jgi:Fe-S oxidoreductase
LLPQKETKLLEKMGVDFKVLGSGCCGLEGSFGFEKTIMRLL